MHERFDLRHSFPAEIPDEMLMQIARRLREHRHWEEDRLVRLLVVGDVVTISHGEIHHLGTHR